MPNKDIPLYHTSDAGLAKQEILRECRDLLTRAEAGQITDLFVLFRTNLPDDDGTNEHDIGVCRPQWLALVLKDFIQTHFKPSE